jgi:hypothetical protein
MTERPNTAQPDTAQPGTERPVPATAPRATRRRAIRPALAATISAVVTATVLSGAAVIGYQTVIATPDWQRDAERIPGIVSARHRTVLQHPQHLTGQLAYPDSPPMGGDHNPTWQRCIGNVYGRPVADEHAVHSLEHGAVWIAYRPGLAADAVHRLAQRVRNQDHLMMSPYPGLRTAVSLQAWGYQLAVDSPADPRIDRFISALRFAAAREQFAPCDGGTTEDGPAAEADLG